MSFVSSQYILNVAIYYVQKAYKLKDRHRDVPTVRKRTKPNKSQNSEYVFCEI